MLKVWAWIYRVTGWYSPWARVAEYKFIKTRYEKCLEYFADPENDMHFEDIIGLEIGMWQAKHKFYRKFKWKKLKK